MNVEGPAPILSVTLLPPREQSTLTKREGLQLQPLAKPPQAKADSYPSPPMSNPPSPPHSHGRGSFSRQSAQAAPSSVSVRTSAPSVPTGPLGASYDPTKVVSSRSEPRPPTSTSRHLTQSGRASLAAEPSPSQTGRKTKGHVASACANCKRAHLSCDVQRPCTRCVASGKQDSCIDVAHKKRGRPRLREEGDSKTGAVMTPALAQPPAPPFSADIGQVSARPIARARHRRAESFRSSQSHASDESAQWPTPGSAYGALPPHYPGPPPRHEVATAFLDLDLVVIKANRPFEQIMLAGQDTRGRHLSDFAAPADSESFSVVRNRLRAEREARDPIYMPPIVQQGQDLVPDITEAEADSTTRGYSDQTYSWTQTRLGAAAQTFPARVRLARASMYFVVVTLPSFRPADPRPLGPPPFATTPSATSYPSDSWPSSQQQRGYFPPQPPPPTSRAGPPPFSQSAARPDRRLSFSTFPPALPPASNPRPMSMLLERPSDFSTRAFPPNPVATRPESIQLPSITSRLSMTTTSTQQPGGEAHTVTTEASSTSETPAKRRRLGINDVLQR